jgi:vesicular inhibitory amino acid transporter
MSGYGTDPYGNPIGQPQFQMEYDEATGQFVQRPLPVQQQMTIDPEGFGSGLTAWEAGWNVTNAIQGMFIVSLPYAVLHGGYWGVFALVFVAYICCYTGKILVACLYEVDPNTGYLVRVRDSYVAIAEHCLGEGIGGKLVNCAQLIELLMTCILYVVLCGDLLIGSFPEWGIDQRSWMIICASVLLPCAFLKDLRAVSNLSFWCTVCHLIVNGVIFGYCILQIADWEWSKVTFKINWGTFPVTLGIVVFSYTSQIFLPSLEGSMADRTQFHAMLDWSHIAAAAFKGGFAWIGFMTFAEQTQEVITNNLPTRGFKALVNLTLVGKALLSYPLPYFAAAQLLEKTFFKQRPAKGDEEMNPSGVGNQPFPCIYERDGEYRVWAVGLRVSLVAVTMLFAIVIPHFALLMGLIGSFTGTMLSFIWPCYFHMKLKWNEMTPQARGWECFIIGLGFVFGIIAFFTSLSGLIDAYHIPVNSAGLNPLEGLV